MRDFKLGVILSLSKHVGKATALILREPQHDTFRCKLPTKNCLFFQPYLFQTLIQVLTRSHVAVFFWMARIDTGFKTSEVHF